MKCIWTRFNEEFHQHHKQSHIFQIFNARIIHPYPTFPDSPPLVIGEFDFSISVKHCWWNNKNKIQYLCNSKSFGGWLCRIKEKQSVKTSQTFFFFKIRLTCFFCFRRRLMQRAWWATRRASWACPTGGSCTVENWKSFSAESQSCDFSSPPVHLCFLCLPCSLILRPHPLPAEWRHIPGACAGHAPPHLSLP